MVRMGVGERVRGHRAPGELLQDPLRVRAPHGVHEHVTDQVAVDRVRREPGDEMDTVGDLAHGVPRYLAIRLNAPNAGLFRSCPSGSPRVVRSPEYSKEFGEPSSREAQVYQKTCEILSRFRYFVSCV